MTGPETSKRAQAPAKAEQVSDLFDSLESGPPLDIRDFRFLLDHIPIAVIVSKPLRGVHRIVYANKSVEPLVGSPASDLVLQDWSALDVFRHEDDPALGLGRALARGEDFVGTFGRADVARPVLVEAYASVIESEAGGESYHIAALVDVSERERAQREEFSRRMRDKDLLLREIQHRVKNNLQLITTLIRLEARYDANNDRASFERLAGRIEALQCLYQELSDRGGDTDVDIGHYLGRIASAVMRSHGVDGIRLDIKVENAPLSINVAMPLGLVVNELLTNAFKHAFAGRPGGTITLECLRGEGGHWRVAVADDGVGLPPGMQWPPEGKLVTLMVQTLRENARTEIRVDSAPGRGTRVTITAGDQSRARRAA